MNARKIIINADDFGFDEDTVEATIELFDSGVISSATIMPNMPATSKAVSYAKKNDKFSFGVHLTFSRECFGYPISSPASIPSLIESDGNFKNSNKLRILSLVGGIRVEQVAAEMDLQIRKLKDMGLNISHVDSHGHIHKFPPFMEALKIVLPRFNLHKVRCVQNVFPSIGFFSPTYFLSSIWGCGLRKEFRLPDFLAMIPDRISEDRFVEYLMNFKYEGLLEIGIHPGYKDDWRAREMRVAKILIDSARKNKFEIHNWNSVL